MKEVVHLTTTLFGDITCTHEEGMMESFDITIAKRSFTVMLLLWEALITQENKTAILEFLEDIPAMYETARAKMLQACATNDTIQFFVEDQIENLEEECLQMLFDTMHPSDISMEMFLDKLEPRTICIAPRKDHTIDCTFDFSLPEDISDELLVMRFDQYHHLYDISHES